MSTELAIVEGAPANRKTTGQFATGRSGNPSGRPKGTAALAQRIRRETKEGRTVVEYLLQAMEHSRSGKERIDAATLLLAYGFGKPVQPTEHLGEGGGPIIFRVEYADDVEP